LPELRSRAQVSEPPNETFVAFMNTLRADSRVGQAILGRVPLPPLRTVLAPFSAHGSPPYFLKCLQSLLEHFLIPWSLLRVRSENIRSPLLLALLVVGLSPFPRFWRGSPFLTASSSLTASIRLAAHAMTACTLGTMMTPSPYRTLFQRPA